MTNNRWATIAIYIMLQAALPLAAADTKLADRSQISGGEHQQQLQEPGLNVRGMVPVAEPIKAAPQRLSSVAPPEMQMLSLQAHVVPMFDALTPLQRQMASRAWGYFQREYQTATGLVNSVAGYRETTLWDVASVIAGTVAAYELGLIDNAEFDLRMRRLLTTLAQMPLYDGKLPNRSYHTDSAKPVVQASNRQRNGSGWSALDIARALGWLAILQRRQPQLQTPVAAVIAAWQLPLLVNQGELQGARFSRGHERRYQEGRLGYEQYAAMALALWELPVAKALARQSQQRARVAATLLPFDRRPRPFLTSDPYYLAKLEFGALPPAMEQDYQHLRQAHANRYRQQAQLSCVGEDAIAWPPWFLYNNLHYQGEPWQSTDYLGKPTSRSQRLSSKCAVALAVLADDPLGRALWQQAQQLHHSDGWDSGIMVDDAVNRSRNLNTNAVILTALLYVHNGNQGLLSIAP
ncbi:DUF3131 domain-containing protein [Ferrimonas senticii]|uniref:DUF3131 domain-containing protein n=1 Tax=Ferrimonas senticii TaxID=394566 RepID=UPI0003FC7B7F|nr:DUF3131 domain-containing protein [Ferrimonas senticii]